MSRTFFTVEQLVKPFGRVLEKSFLVPTEGRLIESRSGKIVFFIECDGEHRFENSPIQTLQRGDILIVPTRCRQFYSGTTRTRRLHAVCLSFDQATLPMLPKNHEPRFGYGDAETDINDFCRHHFQRNYHLTGINDPAIQENLNQIRSEAERAATGYRLRISSLCQNLVVLAARLIAEDKKALSPETDQRGGIYLVTRAKDFLRINLKKPVNLYHIAAHLQISEEHLARTFKQVTGQSVFSYLRVIRLEHAKVLLLNSDQNISEIASSSGFSSLALFSRNFKEYTGLSPVSYRREYGGNTPT
jgi:AraC-like DNA-binding protein